MWAALADHFARYYCVVHFPAMRAEIQRAYDESPLRRIAVPCRGLKCDNAAYTSGMGILVKRAAGYSRSENEHTCSLYRQSLRETEAEHVRELNALFPKEN